MGRPLKEGLNFFSLDLDYHEDEKITKLVLLDNTIAELIYIRLLVIVYRHGYYAIYTPEKLAMLIRKQIVGKYQPSIEFLVKIIHDIAEVGLIDKNLLVQGVITSKGIQRQFIRSTKRRKDKDITKYWLLDDFEMLELKVFLNTHSLEDNDDQNLVNVDNNSKNDNHNEQREKEKEKEKKKDKKDKLDKGNTYGVPRLHFLTKCLINDKYINAECLDVLKYNILFDELTSSFEFEDVLAVTNYIVKYSKRAEVPIDDKYDFFRRSSFNNLEMLKRREKYATKSVEEWLKEFFSLSNK